MASAMACTKFERPIGGEQFRVLFVIIEGTMVLLHGFQKKTQKTPVAQLDLARRRQKEVTTP
jgi:phage-related protein